MRSTTALAALASLGLALSLLRIGDASGALPPGPPASPLQYYGVVQNLQLAALHDYRPSILSQRAYTNAIALGFVHSRGSVVSPTAAYLQEMAGFDLAAINLGKLIWKEPKATRQQLFLQLQNMPGFSEIDALVVVDEPYLAGYTPADLTSMIQEVDQEFGGLLDLVVNFNPKGFFPNNTGYPVPAGLDLVSFNVYPSTLGVHPHLPKASTLHEGLWKDPIIGMTNFLRSKTSAPLLLVAQGFSTKEFELQPHHVDWSVEVAEAMQLEGLVFWYAEPIHSGNHVGFTHISSQHAAHRIRNWGRRILH